MGLDGGAVAAVGARVGGTGVGLLAQFTCRHGEKKKNDGSRIISQSLLFRDKAASLWWSAAAPASAVTTCPPGGAAALVRLGTLGLAHAAVLARRADAGVVDLRLAAAVGVAQAAGAAEVHRVALGDGAAGAAAQARRAEARVRKLTPAPGESHLAPGGRKNGNVFNVATSER